MSDPSALLNRDESGEAFCHGGKVSVIYRPSYTAVLERQDTLLYLPSQQREPQPTKVIKNRSGESRIS